MKKLLKELYPYVVIVIVVVLFRTFIATPVRVDGDSMKDTFHNNDIMSYTDYSNLVLDYNIINQPEILKFMMPVAFSASEIGKRTETQTKWKLVLPD